MTNVLCMRAAPKSLEKGVLKSSVGKGLKWKASHGKPQLLRTRPTQSTSRDRTVTVQAEGETKTETKEASDVEEEPSVGGTMKISGRNKKPKEEFSLDDLKNPFNLGVKSRVFFDDVWTRVNQLGGVMRGGSAPSSVEQLSLDLEIEMMAADGCPLDDPRAQYTTVLVVGATGRVGRILVRKLLLRGYTVKALVRPAGSLPESEEEFNRQALPRSVEVIEGDVGDPEAAARAVAGCNKIVYCAAARTTATADLFRVDQAGVYNLTKAFQDERNMAAQKRAGVSFKSKKTLFKFKREEDLDNWEAATAVQGAGEATARLASLGLGTRDRADVTVGNEETGKGCLFTSALNSRGATASITTPLTSAMRTDMFRYDGFVLRVCGDGKPYLCTLVEGESGRKYQARFGTRTGWQTIRVPFNDFIPTVPGDPPMDLRQVNEFGVTYQARTLNRTAATTLKDEQDDNKSRLEIHFVKLIPRGEEPDFLLISCTGKRDVDLEDADTRKLLEAKLKGEQALRNSGLGYTIVRPGALLEEPGGQKALVFDQGGRINQAISCADVADVLLKGLHDSTARNKSFEVCFEYTPEEGSLYELIAHLPDKSNNYLTAAMSQLDANT